jgi:hypothetical protein
MGEMRYDSGHSGLEKVEISYYYEGVLDTDGLEEAQSLL